MSIDRDLIVSSAVERLAVKKTKMNSSVGTELVLRNNDFKHGENGSDNCDSICHSINAILRRKEVKISSPRSSKDSNSDRDSDIEDSSTDVELQGGKIVLGTFLDSTKPQLYHNLN